MMYQEQKNVEMAQTKLDIESNFGDLGPRHLLLLECGRMSDAFLHDPGCSSHFLLELLQGLPGPGNPLGEEVQHFLIFSLFHLGVGVPQAGPGLPNTALSSFTFRFWFLQSRAGVEAEMRE